MWKMIIKSFFPEDFSRRTFLTLSKKNKKMYPSYLFELRQRIREYLVKIKRRPNVS